jgi:hypothetical protein
MEKSLAGCAWVTPSEPTPPRECIGVVEGRLAEGATCRSHLDCRAGLHCGPQETCVMPELNGSSCGRDVDTLAAHTRQTDVIATHPTCAEHCSLLTHKCEPTPVAFARCFANVGCATGQLCVEGRCTVAAAGRLGLACDGGMCEDGLRCVDGKCAAKAAPGEICASDFDCALGGCSASGQPGGARVCGMTCTHAGDLEVIRKVLAASPARAARAPVASR